MSYFFKRKGNNTYKYRKQRSKYHIVYTLYMCVLIGKLVDMIILYNTRAKVYVTNELMRY